MERKNLWRIVLVAVLAGVAVVASLPTVVPAPKKGGDPIGGVRDLFPGINLGLDLQGGLRLVYEVGVDAAVEDKRDHLAENLVALIKEKAELHDVKVVPSRENTYAFDLVFSNPEHLAKDAVKEALKEYRRLMVERGQEGAVIHMELRDEIVQETRRLSIDQAKETIENRIDNLGLANTEVIAREAENEVIVQIPGVDEAFVARIKRIIAQTAHLAFKIVDEKGSAFLQSPEVVDALKKWNEAHPKEQIELRREPGTGHVFLRAKNAVKGRTGRQILEEFVAGLTLPENREISFEEEQDRDASGMLTGDISWRTWFTEKAAGLTGDYIDQAAVAYEQNGRPYVSLDFNQEGGELFAELTGAHVKERMAIILDGRVQSAPVIQERIGGGRARITLGTAASAQALTAEARDLVVVLNAGALPAPLRPVTESTIGPQLGDDAIAMGKLAFTIAIVVVLVFMLLYYRGGGVAADLALILNGLFVFGILSALGATLTLPGIAGIVLTVGMAVDANVIIYERIREELRAGKSPRAAVDAGYGRAFWTIFDAQVTTFIAGVVMLQYGTGAIKGFAVTLLIGIVTSMFTAIFVSRLVLDSMTRRRPDHLSI